MKHFLLPDSFNGEHEFLLDSSDSHYFKNVLRWKDGDIFDAVDCSGVVYEASFLGSKDNRVLISLDEKDSGLTGGKKVEIILCQCFPKGKKMDLIIRQAAEAGVSVIRPLYSEFSLVKLDKKGWKPKYDRYKRIVREAFQQSGGDQLPVVEDPVQLTKLVNKEKNVIGLFFHQKSIEKISLHKYLSSCPEKVIIVVGPEGGLSDAEILFLSDNNFHPVFLGDNVLRAETAALYAVAAVKTILMERDSWMTVS